MNRATRIAVAVVCGLLALACALVAATDYRLPVAASLAFSTAYLVVAYPLWKTAKRKFWIELPSVALLILATDTIWRLVSLLGRP